ncbi:MULTISPECIES: hypothetical protein [Ochrobactrum]|uniref:Uncharacterized protein n=1 Tax=Ochrobactrum chromiisoli TaxID=2993941 RepID=A0ABT3QQV9_9HYPH|nr:hypothetical protein [Ochrobactrum chromiisoli]MCX2698003.1 hypothetical protein [Ochrobactrum chromiisoli]
MGHLINALLRIRNLLEGILLFEIISDFPADVLEICLTGES